MFYHVTCSQNNASNPAFLSPFLIPGDYTQYFIWRLPFCFICNRQIFKVANLHSWVKILSTKKTAQHVFLYYLPLFLCMYILSFVYPTLPALLSCVFPTSSINPFLIYGLRCNWLNCSTNIWLAEILQWSWSVRLLEFWRVDLMKWLEKTVVCSFPVHFLKW